LAVCLGFFLVVLDTTVLNVALPDIGRQLGGQTSTLQWVVNAYTVVLAGLILSGGAFGDRFGSRRMYLSGLVVFTIASVLCSFAGEPGLLMVARALQGVGAAMLLPASLALITSSYPDLAARSRALGIWGAVAGVAFAGGPLLGGVLTSEFGWRSIFWLNVPVGLLALWATWRSIAETSRRRTAFDGPGQLLMMLTLSSLTYSLIEMSSLGLGHPGVLAAMGTATAGLWAFVHRERTTPQPMLPLSLFAASSFSLGSLAGFAFNFGEYGLLFILSLAFQELHGWSALHTGLAFLPMTLVSAAMTVPGGLLAARLGPRMPLLIGLILMGTGILEMGVSMQTLNALFWLGMLTFGLGSGLAVPPMTGLALSQVPNHLAGVGAAALNAARQVGSVMGVAVLGSVSAAVGSGNPVVPLVIAALVCWLGAIGIWRVAPATSGAEVLTRP